MDIKNKVKLEEGEEKLSVSKILMQDGKSLAAEQKIEGVYSPKCIQEILHKTIFKYSKMS